MMRKSYLLLFLFVFSCFNLVKAQTIEKSAGEHLEILFNKLALSEEDSEKISLNDSIVSFVNEYIKSDSVFYKKLDNIRFLGQITSPDSLVKILTWNVALSDGVQNYYCYFLTREPENETVSTYKLYGESGVDLIRKDTTYSASDWYGALYYDLRPLNINGENFYVLLGLDFKNVFITRKVIEIVRFDSGNNLVLGKRIFSNVNNLNFREVFEFSSQANMTMRFNGENEIIFDHLSPFSPEFKDNFQYYGPDFSYDSFIFEKGLFKLKEDIDIRNQE